MKRKLLLSSMSLLLCLGMACTCYAFDAIKAGDSGETVVEIQSALINLGYLSGNADGVFGTGTETAVLRFQEDHELDATGVVGEATYIQLMEANGVDASEGASTETSENMEALSEKLFENEITGQTFSDDNFLYEELADGTLRIVEYYGIDDTVTISSSAEGKDITEIGNGVFMDKHSIKDFIIWADLTYIGNGAFKGCTGIESISISSDTEEMGVACFEGCSSLESVIMWADLETIPDYCFKDCVKLESMSISSDTKYIGKSAFENCAGLETVIFWGGETIGEAAFRNCTKLDGINIPSKTKYIGTAAFEGCTELTDVIIWDKDTEIVENAFDGCPYQPEGYNIVAVPVSSQNIVETNAEVPVSEETAETEAINESVENETAVEMHSGIRPEFKEAMDSYEAFFDEYVAFMENYDANDMTMILDYASFLQQYTDTMQKLDEVDESTLSPEEDAYYLEVMLRIEQKLLAVTVNM